MAVGEPECLLCRRVPIEAVLAKTHRLYDDIDEAHGVGALAGRLLKEAYRKDPTELCGKPPKTLMAGAIYVAGILKGLPKTQWAIADVYGCAPATIRVRYKHLTRVLGYPSDEHVQNVQKETRSP
jgi:transcription initiation factor TFIIIB Brf1 subunit/transcription initiation factor TFIIB